MDFNLFLSSAQETISTKFIIFNVIKELKLKKCADRAGIKKRQGYDAYTILLILLFMNFLGRSINHFINYSKTILPKYGKDAYYRFTQMKNINWRIFLFDLSLQIISKLSCYVSFKNHCLVLDDTVIKKTGKKIEHLSYVYDHSEEKSVKGLALGWCDGSSFIPLDFALKSSSKTIIGHIKKFADKRCIGYRRRKELEMSKLDIAISMLKRCHDRGVEAWCVLSDSWFCVPYFVKKVVDEVGCHVVSMLKQSNKLTVKISNKVYTTKRLASDIFKKMTGDIVKIQDLKLLVKTVEADFGGASVKFIHTAPMNIKKGT